MYPLIFGGSSTLFCSIKRYGIFSETPSQNIHFIRLASITNCRPMELLCGFITTELKFVCHKTWWYVEYTALFCMLTMTRRTRRGSLGEYGNWILLAVIRGKQSPSSPILSARRREGSAPRIAHILSIFEERDKSLAAEHVRTENKQEAFLASPASPSLAPSVRLSKGLWATEVTSVWDI